jgi:hypothetical protein
MFQCPRAFDFLRHSTILRVADPSPGLARVLTHGLRLPKTAGRSYLLTNGYDTGELSIAN